MKYETTIKRLEKSGFVVVRDIREAYADENSFAHLCEFGFTAQQNGSNLYITGSKQDDSVVCLRVEDDNNPSDSSTDYFPGYTFRSVNKAIEFCRLNAA